MVPCSKVVRVQSASSASLGLSHRSLGPSPGPLAAVAADTKESRILKTPRPLKGASAGLNGSLAGA